MMSVMRWRLSLFLIALVVGSFLLVSSAWAQQGAKAPDFGAHPELEAIADDLHELWRDDPRIFARLDAVRQLVRDWETAGAQREMSPARVLKGLGDEGLLPMLWALVADDPFAEQMGLRGWVTWRVGLLEAVGRHRDERSIPVLISILEGPDPLGATHQTATSALGRTGDVAAIETAIELARDEEQKRQSIVAGLGQARRSTALEYLLEVAVDGDDLELRRLAIRSLGDWANQWAWQTSDLAPRAKTGAKGQSRIIANLVELYGEVPASLRTEIEKSLHLAGAAEARQRVLERLQQMTDDQISAAYTSLAERLSRSPLN